MEQDLQPVEGRDIAIAVDVGIGGAVVDGRKVSGLAYGYEAVGCVDITVAVQVSVDRADRP